MDRDAFRRLRNIRPKMICGDIALLRRDPEGPVHMATAIPIRNALEFDLRLALRWNHETGKKTVVVYLPGVGPICRIDADGPHHGAAGRTNPQAFAVDACLSGREPADPGASPA